MALRNVGGQIVLPSYLGMGAPIFRAQTLDAAGEYVTFILQVPVSGTLKKVGIRVNIVTTADPIIVTVETVNPTSGNPTGTLYAAGATGTLASPTAAGYWIAINGSTGISVTKGDLIAIKLELDYTDGNLQVCTSFGSSAATVNLPYTQMYLNATNSKQAEGVDVGLEYDTYGVVYIPGGMPGITINVSSTWADSDFKKGLVFQVPFYCRVSGVVIYAKIDFDSEAIFYDSDQATAVQTWSLDKDVRAGTNPGVYYLPLATSKILTPNTNYRVVVQPSSGGNIAYMAATLTDDGAVVAMDGMEMGRTWKYTECNGTPANEASWTDTSTIRPFFGIIVDQLDDGTGFPKYGDMSGGLR